MQLTAKRVATLMKRPGRYHDGHGLILVVVNPTNASWQLRYQRNGRERWLGLGPLHTVTLKDARERARAARLQLLDGIDPIDVRRAERAKATQMVRFKAAAEAYNTLHEQKWRNAKHRKQFLASLACYAYPVLGDMTVSTIDTAAVLRVVEPIWLSKLRRPTAFAGASRARWIGQPCVVTAAAIIQPAGRGTLLVSCQRRGRLPEGGTIPHCRRRRSPPSWLICASAKVSRS